MYNANCLMCHKIMSPAERKNPRREIVAEMRTLPEVGTDPTMAMNFVSRRAKSGPLEGQRNLAAWLKPFGAEAPGGDLLLTTVNGVMLADGLPEPRVMGLNVNLLDDVNGLKKALDAGRIARYKARPLNGIWATAPYLHNGSVPTLYDLLNPTDQRPPVFFVGSRVFDPKKVGIDTSAVPDAFRFDTSPQGNWRNGHEFGTSLPRSAKDDLLEFLKTL